MSAAEGEFDRQVEVLLRLGYPAAGGLGADEFTGLVVPLRETLAGHAAAGAAPEPGRVPFVLVVTRQVVPIERTMPLTRLDGRAKPGFVDRTFEEGSLARFVPIEGAQPPDGRAYLLFGVERGEEFCGAVPADALREIAARGRTPLTIEEGVALVTQFPALLAKNKCFSLGASRCGDRRVPALWISQYAPKLGWCWEGNPHTWLGMASAAARHGS